MSDHTFQPQPGLLPSQHLLRPEGGRGVAAAGLAMSVTATFLSGTALVAMAGFFELPAGTGPADRGDPAVISIFGAGDREPWFFPAGWIVAFLQLVTFPLGTAFWIVLLFGLPMKRKEHAAGSWSGKEPPR